MDKEQLIKLAVVAGVKVKWNDEHEWDDGAFMIQVEDNDYSGYVIILLYYLLIHFEFI